MKHKEECEAESRNLKQKEECEVERRYEADRRMWSIKKNMKKLTEVFCVDQLQSSQLQSCQVAKFLT